MQLPLPLPVRLASHFLTETGDNDVPEPYFRVVNGIEVVHRLHSLYVPQWERCLEQNKEV